MKRDRNYICTRPPCANISLAKKDDSLWAVGPAPPQVEEQRVAASGTADTVITSPLTGFTIGGALLTQLGGWISIGP